MLIATEDIVYRLKGEGEPEPVFEQEGVRRVAEGQALDIVALEDGALVVLEPGSAERIETSIEGSIHSLLLLREQPLELLIGTEPPHVYRLSGGSVERIESFDRLECRSEWYTPWGGPPAVRSMACTGDGWVYADIHVGSIMRSADRGVTWGPVTPELHKDVHQVSTCPADDERVYAETAAAFYLSQDRGESWEHRADDLDERYGRAVAVHPDDPDLVLATVSDGPHGENVHGQLHRSEDAGLNWTHVIDGFPHSTWKNIDTFHVTFAGDGTAWATVEKDLYVSRDRAANWRRHWRAPERIVMVSARRPAR